MAEAPKDYTGSPTDEQKMRAEQDLSDAVDKAKREACSSNLLEMFPDYANLIREIIKQDLSEFFGDEDVEGIITMTQAYERRLIKFFKNSQDEQRKQSFTGSLLSYEQSVISKFTKKDIKLDPEKEDEFVKQVGVFTRNITVALLRKGLEPEEKITEFMTVNEGLFK